jgi:translation initiation factor IF-1
MDEADVRPPLLLDGVGNRERQVLGDARVLGLLPTDRVDVKVEEDSVEAGHLVGRR